MEELNEINYPYYETTYLDDDNTKHLAKIEESNFDFYQNRFTIISRRLVNAN